MKRLTQAVINIGMMPLLFSAIGCSGMSRQDKNTATGAAVGGVAGSVMTGGSAAGTVGGAAVGGVIGHETNKSKSDK